MFEVGLRTPPTFSTRRPSSYAHDRTVASNDPAIGIDRPRRPTRYRLRRIRFAWRCGKRRCLHEADMFVALMMVRNEMSILPITLGHLLYTIKVDRLLVADNGSTDGTRCVLTRAAKLDQRLQWTDASGPYSQQSTINGLAQEAHRSGAKWLLPTDADEFHWLKVPLQALDVEGVGAWELQVINFVQLANVHHETSFSLRTMCFRAFPVGSMEDARPMVTSRKMALVQTRSSPKIIVRSAKDLIISKGHHAAHHLAENPEKLQLPKFFTPQCDHATRFTDGSKMRRECNPTVVRTRAGT